MPHVNLEFQLGAKRLQATVDVPAGPARLQSILPIVELVTDIVVDEATKAVTAAGRTISCKAGCGACCRQLVPITATEARRIAALVSQMPEPSRSEVAARFADALQKLRRSGTLVKLEARAGWSGDTDVQVGAEYFHQGIACPFLVDESCSIHADRPIPCREFLVTTPAANCSHPDTADIDRVPLAVQPWTALREVERTAGESGEWVPLVLALEWAASHPDQPATQSGVRLVEEFVAQLDQQRAGAP